MSDWPDIGDPGRIIISPFSQQSMGVEYAASAAAAPASTAWGTNNQVRLYPFVLTEPMLIRKLWTYKGATVTGNVDIGIYTDEQGGAAVTKIVSSGSTAVAATGSILQEFDITDTMLGRGRYYCACALSLSTSTMFATALAASLAKMMGWADGGTTFPLAATITLAAAASAVQPVYGISGRTLVL